MDHPQIIILGCFSKELNGIILVEVIHNLSKFKFDGEGESTFHQHLFQCFHLWISRRVCSKDDMASLITLTFEGLVNQWCHTLPNDFIHSFEQLAKKLHKSFSKYKYQDVCGRINILGMKNNELVEDFHDLFLHLCYEIPRKHPNWDFLEQESECLILVSSYSELDLLFLFFPNFCELWGTSNFIGRAYYTFFSLSSSLSSLDASASLQ